LARAPTQWRRKLQRVDRQIGVRLSDLDHEVNQGPHTRWQVAAGVVHEQMQALRCLLMRHDLQAACTQRWQRNHQRQLGHANASAAGLAQGQEVVAAQGACDGQLLHALG